MLTLRDASACWLPVGAGYHTETEFENLTQNFELLGPPALVIKGFKGFQQRPSTIKPLEDIAPLEG